MAKKKKSSHVSKKDIDFKSWKKTESYEKLKRYVSYNQLSGFKKYFKMGTIYESLPNGKCKKSNVIRIKCNQKVEIDIKFNFDPPPETIVFVEVAAQISYTLGKLFSRYANRT